MKLKNEIDQYAEVKAELRFIQNKTKELEYQISELSKNVANVEKFVFRKDFIGEGRIVRCPRCSYIWKTKSENITTSCPNCKGTINIEDCVVKDIKKLDL